MKHLLRALHGFYRRLAARPALLYPLLFLAGTVGAALPVMRAGVVLPQDYDEFVNLLGAETFLDGRLTNPPHPLAPFFETMHVLQQPTYASKYPPGPALQLAMGALLGSPIFGVWITVGLFTVAAAWMLRALAPATWAATGALAASWQWCAVTYWGHSYWGGSLFALAGMLVFGGALRFWRAPGFSSAWWAGAGAGLMALTRPYEGLWFCVVPAGFMLWRFFQSGCAGWNIATRLRAAGASLTPVAAALLFLGIYNHAVTGSAFTFPHRLYEKTEMPDVGLFVWDHPGPAPAGRHPELTYQFRRFSAGLLNQPSVSLGEVVKYHATKVLPDLAEFYFTGLAGLGAAWAVIGGQAWRRRAGRLALACVAALGTMLLTLRFFGFMHYAAAWCAPALTLVVLGFRGMCAVRWRGWRLPPAVVALAIAGWTARALALATIQGVIPKTWALDRADLIAQLEESSAGDHRGSVVFVMLAEGQPAFAEWVYNGPDIDAQTVIFARSLGPARDYAVARYYPTRHLWQAWLKPSGELDHLAPYQPAPPVAAAPKRAVP